MNRTNIEFLKINAKDYAHLFLINYILISNFDLKLMLFSTFIQSIN